MFILALFAGKARFSISLKQKVECRRNVVAACFKVRHGGLEQRIRHRRHELRHHDEAFALNVEEGVQSCFSATA